MIIFFYIVIFIIAIIYFAHEFLKKTKIKHLISNEFKDSRDKVLDLTEIQNFTITFEKYAFPLPIIVNYYNSLLKKDAKNKLQEVLPSIYCIIYDNKLYLINKNIRNKSYIYMENKQIDKKTHKTSTIDIDPSKLPYPEALGGGCPIWSLFQSTKFYNTPDSLYNPKFYSILKNEDILEITANYKNNEFKKRYCENKYENCYPKFLKKILNGTFSLSSHNKIKIIKYENGYELYEGKHRICASKRYELPKLQVEQTEYFYEKYPNATCNYNDPLPINIIDDYYKSYDEIDMDKEEARYITENVSNQDFISYLEKYYNKDIFDILDKYQN